MSTLSLQERNEKMTLLRDVVKTFLCVEGDPFDHCHISMQESGAKFLDVLVDCHAEERRDKIRTRLQAFGFPITTNAPVRLVFTNPEWQPVISIKAKEEQNLADQTLTNEIFDLVQKHFREKGWKNLVVKGSGFIRVQTKDMARKAAHVIKTLSVRAKPFCTGEDVILYPKSLTQSVNVETFMAYLKEMIGGVFGFQIMDPLRDGNSIIIGFPDEKELIETKFCVTLFGLQEPQQKNQTLVFLPEDPSVGIDEVRSEWLISSRKQNQETEGVISPAIENSSKETVSSVSPDEFKKDVRDFLQKHNIERSHALALREIAPYHYQVGIKEECWERVFKATSEERPEWIVEKHKKGFTFSFYHGTYYHESLPLRETTPPVPVIQTPKPANEGIIVTMQMVIPEEKIQEIIRQAPDNFITKEVQERGLFSSRKETLDTITEEERALILLGATPDELVAEVKRRGSEFAKQLVMNLL